MPSEGKPHAVLGNSTLTFVFDRYGNILHLYFPHVGMWQHMSQFRAGSFLNGKFSWFPPHSDHAHSEQSYTEELVLKTNMELEGLSLEYSDIVHPQRNVFIRRFSYRGGSQGTAKLFFYNRLNINETYYGETVFYDPDNHSLVHFKNGYFFLIHCVPDFSNYACGEHTVHGLLGTFVDAEDGSLRRSEVSHGSADSTIELELRLETEWKSGYYVLIAGRSLDEVSSELSYLYSKDFAKVFEESRAYWSSWAKHRPRLDSGLPQKIRSVYMSSMYVLENSTDAEGAVIASLDSMSARFSGDSYAYCWWRDAAYATIAFSEVGMWSSALRFLKFAARNQTPQGYFYHRHRADGSWGSTWHRKPFIQLDQTAAMPLAVYAYYKYSSDVASLLQLWPMVRNSANFLVSSMADGKLAPSYDLWEESFGVHVYTLASVCQGLFSAERIGDALGKDRRGWSETARILQKQLLADIKDGLPARLLGTDDRRVDSSMLFLINFGLLSPTSAEGRALVANLERKMSKGAGIARYEGDTYWGFENPWMISTLWLAQALMAGGRFVDAYKYIEWVSQRATSTGLLPEQVSSENYRSASVTPLTWSHATFISAVNEFTTEGKVGSLALV